MESPAATIRALASDGDISRLIELLESSRVDADVDEPAGLAGTTALMLAAGRGHVECCALLLRRRADPRRADAAGGSAAHHAAKAGHAAVLQLLLDRGASLAADRAGRFSATAALELAAEGGHASCVALLLGAMPPTLAADELGARERRELLGSALLRAASAGCAASTRHLLAARADVNAPWLPGRPAPLQAAARRGHLPVAEALLDARADVNAEDWNGRNALLLACSPHPACDACAAQRDAGRRHRQPRLDPSAPLRMVQLLSAHGARRVDAHGRHSAEVAAVRHSLLPVLRWLEATRAWTTPLHHVAVPAALSAERAVVLLQQGADVHAGAAAGGPTPLSLARRLAESGRAPEGSAAWHVLRAARAWSVGTHDTFPPWARARARFLLWVGRAIARSLDGGGALLDAWVEGVMPGAVTRRPPPEPSSGAARRLHARRSTIAGLAAPVQAQAGPGRGLGGRSSTLATLPPLTAGPSGTARAPDDGFAPPSSGLSRSSALPPL